MSTPFTIKEFNTTVTPFTYGNVFLTKSYTLWIDWSNRQHDMAMSVLGISQLDVLVSGSMRVSRPCGTLTINSGIWWRYPPGVDFKEITHDQSRLLQKQVEEIVEPKIVERET